MSAAAAHRLLHPEVHAGGEHEAQRQREADRPLWCLRLADEEKGKKRPVPEVQGVADEPHERHRAPRKERAVHERVGLRCNEKDGARDRKQREKARMLAVLRAVGCHGARNEKEPQDRGGASQGLGDAAEVKEPEGFDGGKQDARPELPKAREREVERGAAVGEEKACFERADRDHHNRRHHQKPRLPEAPQDGAENRKDDVELLLDREAPEVKERLSQGVLREVADLPQKPEVLHEARA